MQTRLYTIHVQSTDLSVHFTFRVRLPVMTEAEADELRAGAREYTIQSNRLRCIDYTLDWYYRTDVANWLGVNAMWDYCALGYCSPTLTDGWDVNGVNSVAALFPFVDNDLTDDFRALPITSTTEYRTQRAFYWWAQARAGETQIKFSALFEDAAPGHGGGCYISPTGDSDAMVETLPVYCFRSGDTTGYHTRYSLTHAGCLIVDSDDIVVNYCYDDSAWPCGYLRSAPRWGLDAGTNQPFKPQNNPNAALCQMWTLADTATIVSNDPYDPGGISEPGGGDGSFDFSSTDVPMAGAPSIGAMDTGFIGLYNPSTSNLHSLASYMWSGAFDLDTLKKLFADPMDCILGLHIIPTISGHPSSTAATLMVGNVSTGLSMPKCTEQYYELDCGTVQIPPKWGAYLDYAPYSKLSLYLPYIGFVEISPDDCMRGSIHVKYTIDILSGTCTAQVYCVSNRGRDGHTLYTFNGSCACECPVTSGQYKAGALGVLEAAMGVGSMVGGNVLGGLGQTFSAIQSMIKPEIKRSGGFGGAAGLMAIQYPYLVLTVPRMCTPGEQNKYIGYPSFVTEYMSAVVGYAQIEVTHMEGMTCSEDEVSEIIALLGEGVIF